MWWDAEKIGTPMTTWISSGYLSRDYLVGQAAEPSSECTVCFEVDPENRLCTIFFRLRHAALAL